MLEGLFDSEVVQRDMEEKRAEVTNIDITQRLIQKLICMQEFLKAKLKPCMSINNLVYLTPIT